MRKKFIDKIYMREVTDKVWYLEENEEIDGYIGMKYIKETSKPITYYCNGKKYTALDKGYTMLEYLPRNRGYNCRIAFDEDNRLISLYFDINNGTGIEDGMPWYDDLYLDVIVESPTITEMGYYIRLDDEKEFKTAFEEGIIDEKTLKKGYDTAHALMAELRQNRNDILNRCQYDVRRIKKQLNLL